MRGVARARRGDFVPYSLMGVTVGGVGVLSLVGWSSESTRILAVPAFAFRKPRYREVGACRGPEPW